MVRFGDGGCVGFTVFCSQATCAAALIHWAVLSSQASTRQLPGRTGRRRRPRRRQRQQQPQSPGMRLSCATKSLRRTPGAASYQCTLTLAFANEIPSPAMLPNPSFCATVAAAAEAVVAGSAPAPRRASRSESSCSWRRWRPQPFCGTATGPGRRRPPCRRCPNGRPRPVRSLPQFVWHGRSSAVSAFLPV